MAAFVVKNKSTYLIILTAVLATKSNFVVRRILRVGITYRDRDMSSLDFSATLIHRSNITPSCFKMDNSTKEVSASRYKDVLFFKEMNPDVSRLQCHFATSRDTSFVIDSNRE